jgi:hypothetical protein
LNSAIKVDLIVRKNSEYRHAEFERRKSVEFAGISTWITSREDLILSKLVWARDSGSEMQLRDVRTLIEARSPSRSLPHGDEHQFWLDAGNQIKNPITMQKRHARKNCEHRYQAVIRGSWSYAGPPTSRVQMRCVARCFPSVRRDHHW